MLYSRYEVVVRVVREVMEVEVKERLKEHIEVVVREIEVEERLKEKR